MFELLREFFSYLSDRLPRRARTEMERPRPSESIHSSASQHQCGKTFMTEDRYEPRVKRRPRGVRARGGGWRHARVLRNHLKRKAAERAAPHHTSQSPPRPRRHLTSRDESRSSHDQRHSLEHRMAAKPPVVELIVPTSGPTGGNFDQVKNETLEQLRQEIKEKSVESPRRFESPYSKEILVAPLPTTFKMPNLVIYDASLLVRHSL